MNPDRTDFDDDGELWHQEIMAVVPRLIRRYIQSLSKEELSVEEWAKCLDIFPNKENTLTGHIDYLNTDEFKQLMKMELAVLDFLRCRDGIFEIREILEISLNPAPNPRMKKTTYNQLVDECCKCDIIDSIAISDNTSLYLYHMSNETFLAYPNESEIDIENVKLLWDPRNLRHVFIYSTFSVKFLSKMAQNHTIAKWRMGRII